MDNKPDINNGIFDKDEMDLKLEIRGIRKEIIREFVKNGVPTDNRDIRVLNEVMLAVDSEVTETAKLRNANKAQKSDAALQAAILAKLTARPTTPAPAITSARELLEVEVLPTSLKEGEELHVDDFIDKEEDE